LLDDSVYNTFINLKKQTNTDTVINAVFGKNFPLSQTVFNVTFVKAVDLADINDVDVSRRDQISGLIASFAEKGYITSQTAETYGKLSSTVLYSVNKDIIDNQAYGSFAALESRILTAIQKYNVSSPAGGGSGGNATSPGGGAPGISGQLPYVPEIPENTGFTDIGGVEWANAAINYLAENKIMTGVGGNLFEPDRNIKREEFVKTLVCAFGLVDPSAEIDAFSDVYGSEWYYSYVASAYSSGIVNGISETEFGVGQNLTRQQMAAMVERALNILNINLTSLSKGTAVTFFDDNEISDYAKSGVELLSSAGIINGVGENQFSPNGYATRAMTAKVIYETLMKIK
jgi:hypothetical protein